jgi:hypothetical protein
MITPSYSATATERVLPRMALDFTTASLDSRVTITRALNTATAVNASGYVATVNANLPRFDYDPTTLACKGLLIEEARSNVCIQSADIDNVAWSRAGVGVVGDTVTSPAGTTTGNTVTCSAGSSVHRVVSTAGTVTSGASATHSVFVKAGTHSFFQIHDGSTGTFYANFNLTTGTVTAVNPVSGATITPYGNGWYKCTLTLTAGATTSIGAITIIPDGTSLRNPTWAAAGTESIYAWGYQIEVGAFATSYIPTTTTSVTRNADVVSMTGTNFSDWYNASEGAFSATAQIAQLTSLFPIFISANDGTLNNYLNCYPYNPSSPNMVCISQVGAVQQYLGVPGAVSVNTKTNVCFAYKASSFASAMNGTGLQSAATGSIPTVDRLTLGSTTSNYFLNGHLQKINYWPQRLTNNEVQAFSKVG